MTGTDGLRNPLAPRTHIRRHPTAARRYGRLERRLAERFADDVDGYAGGKTEFTLAILAGEGLTAEQLDGIRAVNRTP